MERAIVLVSGGVNSAVAAAVAREHHDVALLHVAWGHRAGERELAAFHQLVSTFRTEKSTVVQLPYFTSFGGNARVGRRQAIEDGDKLGSQTPGTFVLGLMPSMLSLASAWAVPIGATRIILGVSEDHGVPGPAVSSLYPDHRIEFVQAFNLLLHYAKPADRTLTIEAPLIDMNRTEVIKIGQRLSVPFEHTWSCYRDNDRPCGRCRPCTTRANGFLKAGVPDPLALESAAAR